MQKFQVSSGYDRSAKHRLLSCADRQTRQCSSAPAWVAAAAGCCAGSSGRGHPINQALALMRLKAESAKLQSTASPGEMMPLTWRPIRCSRAGRQGTSHVQFGVGRSDIRPPSISARLQPRSARLQPRRRGVREAGPAARREKCFKLPIRSAIPIFPQSISPTRYSACSG